MLLTDSWKKVKIIELFDIQSGAVFSKQDWGDPIYPYVGASATDNGHTGMCYKYNYENIITINTDGSVGYAFWHPYKFYMTHVCRALIPKFKISDYIGLFLSTILTKTFVGNYNYGKKLTTSRLQQESIYLPFKNNHIDWGWIEDFMKSLDASIIKVKYKSSTLPINTDSWKKFNITDLFTIIGCSGNIKNEGNYPQITATEFNNGHSGNSYEWKHENCFTIAKDGKPGITFWHPYKFDVNSHVLVLYPKFEYSNYISCFISTVMTKSLTRDYSYGKALGQSRLIKESIYLPEKDGEPDWEYMENFMISLIQE